MLIMLSNKQRNTKIISSGFLVEIIQGFYTQIFILYRSKDHSRQEGLLPVL